MVAVIDPSFNMTDNPYGEFKLHKYTITEDDAQDEEVELRDCAYD